jgi:hypothetical protein
MSLIALDLHSFIVATHLFKFVSNSMHSSYQSIIVISFSSSAIVEIILENHLFEMSNFKENYKKKEKNTKIGRLIMLEV